MECCRFLKTKHPFSSDFENEIEAVYMTEAKANITYFVTFLQTRRVLFISLAMMNPHNSGKLHSKHGSI